MEKNKKRRFEIQDKSVILKWMFIAVCLLLFLSLGSVYAYKTIIGTEWYHQRQLKKAFTQEYAHVNDYDKIISSLY